MRTKYAYLILMSFLICLVGCSRKSFDSNDIATNQCEQIIKCISDEDSTTLKSLFCQNVLDFTNLEEQIKIVFNLFKDKNIVSYDIQVGSESKAIDKGSVSRLEVYPIIKKVILSDNSEYEIYFYSYIVYTPDDKNEGISEITITDKVGNEYKIGNVSVVHPKL